jgi:hypothetical protein
MGTRHFIGAVLDGEFKIAQYGQWDGYPEGQGVDVLAFVAGTDMAAFKAKLAQCSWITKEQTEQVNGTADWHKVYPHLSRDAGADILTLVMGSEAGLFLADTRGFAGDSLFCEWGYVLDLDAEVLEVYRGFNKTPTPADSRFPSGADWLEHTDGYEPVRLVKRFPFASLPSKDQFVTVLNDEDDAEINWAGQMTKLVSDVAAA